MERGNLCQLFQKHTSEDVITPNHDQYGTIKTTEELDIWESRGHVGIMFFHYQSEAVHVKNMYTDYLECST